MKKHHPDGWTILQFDVPGEPILLKIFATWRWSNEKWQLSSGSYNPHNIRSYDSYFEWEQESGSIYHLPKDGENGSTMWQSMKLDIIIDESKKRGASISVVKLNEFFTDQNGLPL
ncbi:MAG: hypothetical protein V7749_12680 [Cocleimonas sp.]